MWVDQHSVVICLKMWCSTSKASNWGIYDFVSKCGKTGVLLCENKDFLDTQLQNTPEIAIIFLFLYIHMVPAWITLYV